MGSLSRALKRRQRINNSKSTENKIEQKLIQETCDAFNKLWRDKKIAEETEYRFIREGGILKFQMFIPEETPNGIIEHGLTTTDCKEIIVAAGYEKLQLE